MTPDSLILTGRTTGPPRHGPGEFFLRGPIPWVWLSRAAELPGRALAIAVVLWHYAGMTGTALVPLNLSSLPLKIDRSSASRGIVALERAGLVRVSRRPGRKLLVTLVPAS